ncbi:hypothetical protein A9Q93_01725 [Nonlabens dokdonensis]|uniref:Uncharacterized protein n=1 Tax=Nonlabens dokdonensis TaxID=328515 RepID=A0A1Z8BCB0_9FLAO|nr:hypothetical protein [Nonlabens dokdonensis]OUS20148.1 hypothetical protein A9Q93_01725 [Nonlabens dokdonensis]
MNNITDKSLRCKVLAFFEIKEGLIKSVSGKSYLDYIHYSFLPIAFIISIFTDNYYFFDDSNSLMIAIWILLGLVWALFYRFFLHYNDVTCTNFNSGVILDLSVYAKQLIIYRILAAIAFCALIGLIGYFVFVKDYNFVADDLFIYIFSFWILIILGGLVVKDENKTTRIIKIESDKLRVDYKKGEKYVLLKDLKQIKIAGTHLSFFPMEGKIEMLNDFELDEKEQLQLKSFLSEHMPEISVSIYETRLEIFNDNKQEG